MTGEKFKDGLFVQPYHAGAGANDAVLATSPALGDAGFLNGTPWQVDLANYPWGFDMPGHTDYVGWEMVTINTGTGSADFNPEDAPGLLSNPGPSSSFEDTIFSNL